MVRLDVRQIIPPNQQPADVVIEIDLRPTSEADRRRLMLSFLGVHGLQIVQPPLRVVEIPKLEIASIRERQWEELNYEVSDPNSNVVRFACRSFHAVIKE